jgi:hypothetical protein
VDRRNKSGHDNRNCQVSPESRRSLVRPAAKTFFIISVDRIFTILFGAPFTNVFDVIGANAAIACVYPPRTTD